MTRSRTCVAMVHTISRPARWSDDSSLRLCKVEKPLLGGEVYQLKQCSKEVNCDLRSGGDE